MICFPRTRIEIDKRSRRELKADGIWACRNVHGGSFSAALHGHSVGGSVPGSERAQDQLRQGHRRLLLPGSGSHLAAERRAGAEQTRQILERGRPIARVGGGLHRLHSRASVPRRRRLRQRPQVQWPLVPTASSARDLVHELPARCFHPRCHHRHEVERLQFPTELGVLGSPWSAVLGHTARSEFHFYLFILSGLHLLWRRVECNLVLRIPRTFGYLVLCFLCVGFIRV